MVKNFDPKVIAKTNAIMTRAMNGVLAEQGFVDFPHRVGVDRGKTSYGSYAYQRARLDDDLLTYLFPYVKAKGGYILVELNVVRLRPAPRQLSDMKDYNGGHFLAPSVCSTKERVFLDHPRGFFGGDKRYDKLEARLKACLSDLPAHIARWHKSHDPLLVDWSGKPVE